MLNYTRGYLQNWSCAATGTSLGIGGRDSHRCAIPDVACSNSAGFQIKKWLLKMVCPPRVQGISVSFSHIFPTFFPHFPTFSHIFPHFPTFSHIFPHFPTFSHIFPKKIMVTGPNRPCFARFRPRMQRWAPCQLWRFLPWFHCSRRGLDIPFVSTHSLCSIYDYLWLSMIIYDYLWLSMIIYDYLWLYLWLSMADWWFGTWILWLSIYWECHHPNWLSYFSEGLKPPTR